MMDPMIASYQSFIGFLRADLGIEFVPSEEGTAEEGRDIPCPDRYDQKEDPLLSIGHVPNQGDMGEKKSDIENSKEHDSHMGDG